MLRLLIASLIGFYAGIANAGDFVTANYGNTKVKDFQDLVTREFTMRFPADSWELFIYSDAFTMSRSGQAICNAIVGVVPRGVHQFPRRQFQMTKTATVKPGCWRRLNLDSECQSNFDRGLVANS